MNSLVLGVAVSLGYDKPEGLKADARMRANAALAAVLAEDDLLDLVEGVSRVERTTEFPKEGDTFLVEERIAVTFELRTVWDPSDPPPLRRVEIQTRPAGASPDVPPIKTRIDLPGDEPAPARPPRTFP